MQFIYFSESISDETGIEHTTYGIKTINEKNPISINDITLEKDCIEKLCKILNDNEIERCHIMDIVRDFVSLINTPKISKSLICF